MDSAERAVGIASDEECLLEAPAKQFLVSTYPAGTEILASRTYRPGYRAYPMRVRVRTPSGRIESCVIKTGERIERLESEARVLAALAEIGLPVPAVLAGPVALADDSGTGAAMLLRELPGQPLPWLGLTSLAEADLTCRLLIRGVDRLHELTDSISRHAIAESLPRDTLSSELRQIVQRGGEWLEVELFARAVELLPRALAEVEVPLVFSNRDYNPLNFLHDGETLTGWVDFEGARFEDPHVGFVKFLLWSQDEYGWGAGVKAGLVERYLYTRNVSRREFAPRLVLRCLQHLQRELSVHREADALQRQHMVGLLTDGLADMLR
jgi:aminoglycoside phosphotransferase (APT) family kinase protein